MKRSLANLLIGSALMVMSVAQAGVVHPNVLVEEAMVHLRDGETEQGIIKLEAANMLRQNDVRLLYQLGLAYYNVGTEIGSVEHVDRAQNLWQQAFQLTSTEANDMLKATLEDIIKRADIRKDEIVYKQKIEKVLESNPDALEENLEYAGMLLKKGDTDSAAKIYRRLMEVHGNDPRPYTKMASVVHRMGRILWAERYYDQALKSDPNYEPAKKGLSSLYENLELLRLEGYENIVKASHGK